LANQFYEGKIKDCGPVHATHHAIACKYSKSANIIACANPALFTKVCDGCNPLTVGIAYTKLSI
jgi:hypothetical protein